MDRFEILNGMFDRNGVGLEIGPSYNPVVSKASGARVETLDHCDQKALLEKYKNSKVDVEKIERSLGETFNAETLKEERQALAVRIEHAKVRLSRLTDAFIDRHIDEATFYAKQEVTQLELQRLDEEQVAARDERGQLENTAKFFELVKSLAALYDSAELREKREIVSLASSNRWLDGKCIVLEPSDWLAPLKDAMTVAYGAPYRPTLRMSKQQVAPPSQTYELTAEQVQRIFAAAKSEPVRALREMFDKGQSASPNSGLTSLVRNASSDGSEGNKR